MHATNATVVAGSLRPASAIPAPAAQFEWMLIPITAMRAVSPLASSSKCLTRSMAATAKAPLSKGVEQSLKPPGS
jgi:hypothetical protein